MVSTLPSELFDVCRRWPDHCAFVYQDRRTSYAELWNGITHCARALRSLLSGRGARVAVLIENSPEYAVAYYGALKAGAVVVGMNTALRAPELVKVLRHCEAEVLVIAQPVTVLNELLNACPSLRVLRLVTESVPGPESTPLIELEWLSRANTAELAERPLFEADTQAAAIIYTSGTTGDPKGVTLSHRNLLANTRAIQSYLGLTAHDCIVNVLPFYYSYGNSVLHTHLLAGARIVLENTLSYPHLVVQRWVTSGATGFAGVPSTFALLLARVNFAEYDLSALRYLTQAGGAMAPALTTRVTQTFPQAKLFVMYGQTEATARITYLPPSRLSDKPGAVGLAVSGVRLEIRDEQGRNLPPGQQGEVCVQGDNVMVGYWNNPEATQRVLREGWLHTGDLGYLDTDGFLFLTGRSSDFIKTGAHRVSPQEIEEVIMELPAVMECAVIGVPDDILGEVIKAWLVLNDAATLEPLAVQAHCRQRLAVYKVPKVVEFVVRLPKTASGKVQRFLLRE